MLRSRSTKLFSWKGSESLWLKVIRIAIHRYHPTIVGLSSVRMITGMWMKDTLPKLQTGDLVMISNVGTNHHLLKKLGIFLRSVDKIDYNGKLAIKFYLVLIEGKIEKILPRWVESLHTNTHKGESNE